MSYGSTVTNCNAATHGPSAAPIAIASVTRIGWRSYMSNALVKPGKRLAKLLDPRCYIVTELYNAGEPTSGIRYRVHDADGKSLATSQNATRAWVFACRVLTLRLGAKLGLTTIAETNKRGASTKGRTNGKP